jgi:uracil-DNA glycosylase
MSRDFHQLIDAAIGHLQAMRGRGAQFISLQPETLRALNGAALRNRASKIEDRGLKIESAKEANGATAKLSAPAPSLPSPLSSQTSSKAEAIAQLHERAMQCVKCPQLSSTRQNVVFGVGNIDAEVMFVGEAPGADEDVQGEPFVGAAGQLLTRMINAMGLSRDKVYIANILKCRPDMPAGSSGNRKPTPEEMQTCIPYLHAQIDLIQPKVLVALGGTALEGLLKKSGIMKLRGTWHIYRDIPLMPTYHPAYLLRNQSNAEKRKVWEDLMAVMDKAGLPISDKQRGYFLKA